MNRVPQIKFENSYRSDHSPVGLSFKFNDFLKGKGLWKFNNSLLTDKIYIDIIKKTIVELKIQYACPIYNFNNLNTITNNDIQFIINDQLFMDILLTEIRGKSISYSSFKKKKLNEREKELEKDILLIEQNLTDDKLDILTKKQEEILEIRKNRLKGQCIRSKSKWIEEGEKPTKYFINLETQNYVSKQIPKIEKDDGSVIFDQMEILHETKCFYENLYKKRDCTVEENIHEKLKEVHCPKLSPKEAMALEGPLNESEILNFL